MLHQTFLIHVCDDVDLYIDEFEIPRLGFKVRTPKDLIAHPSRQFGKYFHSVIHGSIIGSA